MVLSDRSDKKYVILKGDWVARLICEKIFYPDLVECESLNETERSAWIRFYW